MDMNLATTQLNVIENADIFCHKFKSGGSSSMAVDGSVTPVVFTLEDINVEEFLVTHISFVVSSGSILDITNFAGLPALANGIGFAIDGTIVFNTNADILLFMTDTIVSTAKITGTEYTIMNGHCMVKDKFQNSIISKKNDFKITINDNLSTVKFLEVAVSGIKIR